MVAFIEHDAPHLFTRQFPDGSHFRCSESFVRDYLRTLGWSERCATRAAQKLPDNYEQILNDSFLRQASIIRDHAILLRTLCLFSLFFHLRRDHETT